MPNKRAKVADHAKTTWLITYGSGCPHISHSILSKSQLPAREVYTIQWRESKYTLVHLCSRIRRSAMEAGVQQMRETYGIIQSEIVGYDSVTCNTQKTELEQHPGFQRMLELLNKQCPSLSCWIQGDATVYSYNRGLLWPYIETTPDKASPAQMRRMLAKWEPMVRKYESVQVELESLLNRMGHCEAKAELAELHVQALTAKLELERYHNSQIAQELLEKRSECNQLRGEILGLQMGRLQ